MPSSGSPARATPKTKAGGFRCRRLHHFQELTTDAQFTGPNQIVLCPSIVASLELERAVREAHRKVRGVPKSLGDWCRGHWF